MSDNSVIAKSGWLDKLTETGWCRGWFELYRDGYLKYYENDHSPNAEDIIIMPSECILIKTGNQVVDQVNNTSIASTYMQLHPSQCLFSISTSNKVWYLRGDSLDDMRAWQLALEQARLLISSLRPVPRVAYSSVFEMSSNYPHGHESHASYVYGSPPPTYLPAYSTGSYTYYPQSSSYAQNSLLSSVSHDYVMPLDTPAILLPQESRNLFHHHPLHPHPRPDSRDVAFGMLAGAAVGSVVWGSPYYWWQ